jgi:hypothetical protein
METLTEEVVSESSQNTVESETQGEGNLSMAEFADQLLKRRQPEEEVTEPTEEVDEPAEETAEPTDALTEQNDQSAEVEAEEEEESSPPAEPSDNVLSKFNIDLDNLSEEESRDLAKALNASAVKRFGRLTAQKKALLAENAELQAQAEQAQQTQSAELPEFLKDNALHNVQDAQSLNKEVEQLTALVEWADENLDNEVEYDDNGNEYLAKDGDKVYSKADLRRIKANANKILRKDAPARQKWLQEREQANQQAMQTFEFLGDEHSESYKLFMQVKESPLYKPLVQYLPNSNYALGLMVEGFNAVAARQEQKAKPIPKPKAPTASTEAGTARPKSPQANAQKALQAAKAKFDKSGSMADYQAYLKLKNKS